jgi:hypothetical protein
MNPTNLKVKFTVTAEDGTILREFWLETPVNEGDYYDPNDFAWDAMDVLGEMWDVKEIKRGG